MAMANTQELPDMMSKLVIDCQASDIDEEMTVGNMTPKSRDVREPQPIYAKLRALEQYVCTPRRILVTVLMNITGCTETCRAPHKDTRCWNSR